MPNMRGFKEFLKNNTLWFSYFYTELKLTLFGLKLPYSSIIDIEKLDGRNKISIGRLVALGFLTGPRDRWFCPGRKKHVYTVTHYNDYFNTFDVLRS